MALGHGPQLVASPSMGDVAVPGVHEGSLDSVRSLAYFTDRLDRTRNFPPSVPVRFGDDFLQVLEGLLQLRVEGAL